MSVNPEMFECLGRARGGGLGEKAEERGEKLPRRISVKNTPARKVSESQAQAEKNSC